MKKEKLLENFIDKFSRPADIHGRDEYLNSAVLVPVIFDKDTPCLVFEKRNAQIRQGGEICFPGGIFDIHKDKGIEDTAIRETIEELGISRDKIGIIGRLDTQISISGIIVEAFVAVLDIDSVVGLPVAKSEVDKVFSVPLNFFVENEPDEYFVDMKISTRDGTKDALPIEELGISEIYKTNWGRKSKVYVYRVCDEVIWGITARFVRDFVSRIK